MHTFSHYRDLVLDLLFPRSARAVRIAHTKDIPLSAVPRTTLLCGTPILTLASYHDSAVQDAIRALKFEHNSDAQKLLSALLDDFLLEDILERAREHGTRSYGISIPLSPRRIQERGYNQVDYVVSHTHAVTGAYLQYVPHCLIRTRDTAPQTTLHKRERHRNVHGAFAVPKAYTHLLAGTQVYLFDDVATTGATLAEAASALRTHGAHVTCVAFARA